jgi:glycosyltransferase involved in cell wall biosynthesis
MKITAILTVRNEAKYLPITLRHLVESGISLAIIDNESTDSSKEIFTHFREHILHYSTLPYANCFSLTDQLAAKARVMESLQSDWWIHQDADEILESPRQGETLRQGIERQAREGANAINFDEFVFTPVQQQPNCEAVDFRKAMLHYYFFEPEPKRLWRAWRNGLGFQQAHGGHKLTASVEIKSLSESFILRHYIVLSQDHANRKYSERRFATEDLAQGWHGNRRNIPASVTLPVAECLERLEQWDSKSLKKRSPRKHHFWQPEWAYYTTSQ